MSNYLVIAKPGAPSDWFKVLRVEPKRVVTHFSDGKPCNPSRVIVDFSSELEALAMLDHEVVKSVSPSEPLTREQMAAQINKLYQDGSELANSAADALLNLMAHLDAITKSAPKENDT
jgi:hypothetical protein